MPVGDEQWIQEQLAALATQRPAAMPTGSPDDGTRPSWTGLLGNVFGGGQSPGYKLRGSEADTAGNKALLNFGINMLLASGPAPVRPDLLSAAATGLQGAQQSMDLDQRRAQAAALAQYSAAREQRQDQLAALKEALPLLQLQRDQAALANLKNPGNTSTAGAPGGGGAGTYEGSVLATEGTGRNPRSTAEGHGQFLESTWQGFVAANPALFAGMSPAQILAARNDPAMGTRATTWLAQQNAPVLQAAGVAPSGVSLRVAHYLGATAAAKVMQAPDNAPVAGFVSPEAVKANPELATMTAGQLRARYANTPNPAFLQPTQTAQGPAALPGGPPAAPGTPAPYQVATAGNAVPPPSGGAPSAAPATVPRETQVRGADGVVRTVVQQVPVTPQARPGAVEPETGLPVASGPAAAPASVVAPPVPPPPAPAMAVPPPFQMRPLTPTEQAATSYDLPPDMAAEIARDKANAPDVASFRAAEDKERAAKLARRNAADTERLRIEASERTAHNARWQEQQKQEATAQAAIDADARKQRDAIRLKEIEKDFDRDKEGARVTFDADKNRLTKSGEDANNKQMIGNQLRQVRAVLPGLPNGVLASIIGEYPQLTSVLRLAGVLSPQQATDAQLIQGMTNFLATEIKPLGTGSMQVAEMNTFKTVLPTLLQTPEGRVKALAFLQNVNDRGVAEHDFAQQYFRRIDPATGKPAYNLDGLPAAINKPRQEGGLGPVIPAVPRYTNPETAAAEAERWLNDNVEVGHPFMGWGYPLDKHSGKPLVIDPQTGKKNALVPQLMVREN